MRNNSNNNGMSTFGAIICTVLILLVIGAVLNAFEPKCIYSGCDNSVAEESNYCYLHRYTNYSSYKKNYSSGSSYDSNSNYGNSAEKAKDTSTYNSGYTNKSYANKSSSSSNKDDDPYGAKDYSDPEDFYYDNYDDFWDYEDAEDYYNDVWDE